MFKYNVGDIVDPKDTKGKDGGTVLIAVWNDRGENKWRTELNNQKRDNQFVSNCRTGGEGQPGDGGQMFLIEPPG